MKKIKTLRKGSTVREFLDLFLSNHENYNSCFFWRPPSIASQRRSKEFSNYMIFEFQGKVYELEQDLEITCTKFYWTSSVLVNGKKKDIRIVKNLLKGK
mgnify:FL=1